MATYTATAAEAGVPARFAINGDITRVVDFTMTTALSAGDVIQMVKVPAGAQILSFALGMIDVPTTHSGVITFDIGDGNSASALATTVLLSGTAVSTAMRSTGYGYSYSAEDTIDLKVTAISAAGASGGLRLSLRYTLDGK